MCYTRKVRAPGLQTKLFPNRPSAPLPFRRSHPQCHAGEGRARDFILDFRCRRAEEFAYLAMSPCFSPWAGPAFAFAPRARSGQERRTRTGRRIPKMSKMKMHLAICMKAKDDDKMSFGEQVWILARFQGKANCACVALNPKSWLLNPLPCHQAFHGFAFADQFRFGSVYQNFGGAGTGVVVGG